MDLEYLKELTRKYVQLDKEYKEYRDQFFTTIWSGKVTKKATKILNREELKKLEAMRSEVNKVHEEWLRVARGEV